ncbi:MAG: hypothetical protein EXS50_01865 [Candidatus Taylorbacteria bacterium]|nr:hypothetical protein [Candidatus Taylorbacteria bacterium]
MISLEKRKRHITKDIFIIILSVIVTIILQKTGALADVIRSTAQLGALGSFLAGIFFTSIFTITPAGAVLAGLVQEQSLLQVAVFGALGAVIGDLIIYLYVKDALASDIIEIVNRSKNKRFLHFIHLRIWRYLTPLLGAIVVASPLPDEQGLAMMGLSKTKTFVLIPISFTFNFIGIIIIALTVGHLKL